MREPDLAQRGDLGAAVGVTLAVPDREGGPFPDAVGGEDGCAPRRRREEGGLRAGTPRCDEMMPRTQTFSPSEFFIAWGNDRHERGKARSVQVRIRSNFSRLRS
jgi:hypothetical protein